MRRSQRHGELDDDAKSLSTTRRARQLEEPDNAKSMATRGARGHGEPDDDAKSPRSRWARRRREEPDHAISPTTRTARCHGEPEFGAGPCPAPFFFQFVSYLCTRRDCPILGNFYFLVTSV